MGTSTDRSDPPTVHTGIGGAGMTGTQFHQGTVSVDLSFSDAPDDQPAYSSDAATPQDALAGLRALQNLTEALQSVFASGPADAIAEAAVSGDATAQSVPPASFFIAAPAQPVSSLLAVDTQAEAADADFAAAIPPGFAAMAFAPAQANELPIQSFQQGATAMNMANEIFGDGIQILGATYTGDGHSGGIFSNGDLVAPLATPGDRGVILSTGRARDFTRAHGNSKQHPNQSTDTDGVDNHPDFNAAAGTSTYDASFLDVDFIPNTSVLTMQFIFASEEYPEFQNSQFQDFVGVWVNGTRVGMSVGDGDIDPNNLNPTSNINLYIDNQGGGNNTEMDGFTVTMTVTMYVTPGQVNSLRVGIADVGDANYDSNLLIAGGSIQGTLVAIDDWVYVDPNGSATVDVVANDINNGPANGNSIRITHINGQAVSTGSIVVLPSGQSVKLNSDGTLTITGDGDSEDFDFTYTISNGQSTDTGFVNSTSIPCFVAGTLIATPQGEVPVEMLRPGDLVMTQDDGPQPLRWAGTRRVDATQNLAPILIRAGAFGQHRDLLVSPLHRVLIRDTLAELLFGEAEVLVAARDLVNDHSVTRRAGGQVTYVHLMFDRHQVVYSEGLPTESFLPGPQTTKSFETEIIDEIRAVFPELDPHTGDGYSPAARRTLKRYEADLLRTAANAA